MRKKNVNARLINICLEDIVYSKQLRSVLVTLICIYVFVLVYISHEGDDFSHSAILSRNDNVQVEKIGILFVCSYIDIINESAETLLQIATQTLPSLYKSMESNYEYEIYIGIESDKDQAPYTNLNQTETPNIKLIQLSKLSYSDSINELANQAFDGGSDYFAVLQLNAVLKWRYWTTRAIRSLKGHCPSDVGIVVQECSEYNQVSIISRRHFEVFGYLCPPDLKEHDIAKWLITIYLPNHVSSLSSNHEQHCILKKDETVPVLQRFNQTRARQFLKKRLPKERSTCVVSYSLYGTDKRYTEGAKANARLMKSIYPGWKMWIYHDSSVPSAILFSLCEHEHVRCIDMTGSRLRNKMLWRFLVTSSLEVSKYVIRDIDARLSVREKAAVNEWIQSGQLFHVMRDHPCHNYTINGGLWGGTSDALIFFYVKMIGQNPENKYISDMKFLHKTLWPIISKSVFQHDSFFCEHYGGHPFPTLRNGQEHVGAVFINGMERETDAKILMEANEPRSCVAGMNLFEKI